MEPDEDRDEIEPPASLDDARDQAARAGAADEVPKPKRRRPAGKTRPRKTRADSAPRATSATPRQAPLKRRLADAITTVGAMLLLISPADGALIIAGAEKQAAALDALAREQPAVKRALERLLTASVYGQLLAAFAPTLLGLAANHSMLPTSVNGLVQMVTAPRKSANADDAPAADFSLADLTQLATTFGPMMAAAGGANDGSPFGAVVGVG